MGKIMRYDVDYSSAAIAGVTGVKGGAESVYRRGNVDLTPENIGALAVGGDSADNTVSFETGDDLEPEEWTDVATLGSGETLKSIIGKISTMFKNIRYLKKTLVTLNTDIAGALFSITNLRKRVVLTVTTTEFHYTGAFVVIPANSYYALSAMAIYNDTAAEWIGIGNNNTYSPSCLENASAGRSHASCASIGYIAEETTLYIWAKYNATGENTILINGFCITPK